MKRVWLLTVANLRMQVRARQALFWNLAFPLILLSLLSLVFGKGAGFSVTVGVAGQGPLAGASVAALSRINGVTVKEGSEQAEIQALKQGNRDAVLVIPAGEATPGHPLRIIMYYDQTNLGQSSAVVSLVSQVVTGLNQQLSAAPPALELRQQGIAAASNNYLDYLAPGIIGVSLMTSSITGIASRLAGYREQRILKRLRATPLRSWEFIGANVLSQLVVALLQVLILTVVAQRVFGVHITGSMLLVLGLAMLGSLAFLTIGFALSGFGKTVDGANAIANAITMPMMFLSGVYFPVSGAPDWLKPLINVLPLTYLANGLRDVMIHGAGLSALGTDVAALLITALLGMAVAARTFRWE
jgi:ABC-2 type transport system permease protein